MFITQGRDMIGGQASLGWIFAAILVSDVYVTFRSTVLVPTWRLSNFAFALDTDAQE